jgi:N-methylhydantoinase A
MRVGVEVGGTFTDLIWIDADGRVRTYKRPSTPGDPSEGVTRGLEEALGAEVAGLTHLVHGSTVATNAVIERKGCRAGLITTKGFRGLLVLQRQLRPNVYAMLCEKPEPLIPLERTCEIAERIDAAGEVVQVLDPAEAADAVDAFIRAEAPEALAVCLLHAYRNPDHERRVRDVVQARHPGLPIILSSEVLPTFREYERASTTAMAAYLAPLVGRYLATLETWLKAQAPDVFLFVMQSSGGVLPSGGARTRSIDMLNSGPAAGVIAAQRIAGRVGDQDLITVDIGGTSADVCLIKDRVPDVTAETEIDGLPVGRPSIDIANVGAGGGSLAWIDEGGMLQVGPRSAGARPGPACYGHGGTEPAITDALLHLGWLRPKRFLGGRMILHADRAEAALSAIGGRVGQDATSLARAMVDISVAHVSRGVRLVSVQRGHDPRNYALYAYGGMGPALAALAAQDLKVGRVVVPPHPGLFSALGLLVADLRRVYRETQIAPVGSDAAERVGAVFERLMTTAAAEFAGYGYRREAIRWEFSLEMRHPGQGFELLAPIALSDMRAGGKDYLIDAFEAAHRARYGAVPSTREAEIVTYRLSAEIPTAPDVLDRLTTSLVRDRAPDIEQAEIAYDGRRIDCRFAWREDLPVGHILAGAAVIEEPTATTFVPPGWTATVHPSGALILEPGSRP